MIRNSNLDPFVEKKEMQKIVEDIKESFVSEYEITAQNILPLFLSNLEILI